MAEPKIFIVDEPYHWARSVSKKDRPAIVIYKADPEPFVGKWFDSSLTHPGIDVIVADGVKLVDAIGIGGHITLGKSVETIRHMQNMSVSEGNAPISVPEYGLPLRIDFESPVPPTVEKVSHSSIELTEIHVPAGALDAYLNHKQWRKAAYFVDGDGNVVDHYAERHKQRLEALRRAEEAKIEAAKQAKLAEMGSATHSMLAPARLAQWNPGDIKVRSDRWTNGEVLNVNVQIKNMTLVITVPVSAPLTIWNDIAKRLAQIEQDLTTL